MTVSFRGFAALVLLPIALLRAQRNCKTGVPCGGSCISASKACHVGASAPAAGKDTVRPIGSVPPKWSLSESTTTKTLPAPSFSGLYADFVEALRPWLLRSVVIRNSGGDDRTLRDARLAGIKSDHVELTAAGVHIMIPFSSIEMVYWDNPPTLQESALTVVIRR